MPLPLQKVLRARRQGGGLLPVGGLCGLIVNLPPDADRHGLNGGVVHPAVIAAHRPRLFIPVHGHLPGVQGLSRGTVQGPAEAPHPAVYRQIRVRNGHRLLAGGQVHQMGPVNLRRPEPVQHSAVGRPLALLPLPDGLDGQQKAQLHQVVHRQQGDQKDHEPPGHPLFPGV